MTKCKNGHPSEEPDYCSVCGVAMQATGAGAVCPSCGEPRAEGGARYCEVCRFDFVAQKQGPAPTATPVVPKAVPMPAVKAPPPMVGGGGPVAWQLLVSIDPSLDTEPDPATPCPKDENDRMVPIDRDVLVGREDDQRDIHPEVAVRDPGASRRHAKFVRLADGGIALQDLASTNGTKLNGVEVAPGSRHPLSEGDAVTLGRWTRIVLLGRA